ncbi:MAG: hypothetical protein AABZ53_07775 [Planctomycetota bacterium]
MRCTLLILTIVAASLTGGCESEQSRLAALAARAASPTAGRAATATQMAQFMSADKISPDAALTMAFDMVEEAKKTPSDGARSAAATAFAGTVLDAIAIVEGTLAQAAEFELFWQRVGGLAFNAAEEAHANGRLAEADSLVLAGGKRWQNEYYWSRRPDHDGLVAWIWARVGRQNEAIQRLRSRADLQPPADEVLKALTGSN